MFVLPSQCQVGPAADDGFVSLNWSLIFFSFPLLGFAKPEVGSAWKILWGVGCRLQEWWMGAYKKLYLHHWVSLYLND